MKQRRNHALKFGAVVIILGVLTYLLFSGAQIGEDLTLNSIYETRLGIDIKGGVSAVLYPDKENPTIDELKAAKSIIDTRLDSKAIFDRTVTIDKANKRILVEIPWKGGETEFNPRETIEDIGETARLTFREVDESKVDENGNYLPLEDKIIIEGKDVKDAQYVQNPNTKEHLVKLELNSEGAKKFAEATKRLLGKPIAIFMDDTLIVAPTVQDVISDGIATINGQRSAEEAGELADKIRSGSLPFKLEYKDINTISPLLGENALSVTIIAGFVAFALVALFMLLIYRLPGLIADIALAALVMLTLLSVAWFNISLTLPGIAGIILTVGMGVDANVITFERIKEELNAGKTLKAAIDVGFKRAFSAIVDTNVTVMISGAILYYFGSGAIKGFAVTLFVGVILSFLTAVTATRIMIHFVSDHIRNPWLYGLKRRKGNANV